MTTPTPPNFPDFPDSIDARSLKCPLPVLMLRRRLARLGAGAIAVLITDDPASVLDVPVFCSQNGHTLVSQGESGGVATFTVRAENPGSGTA